MASKPKLTVMLAIQGQAPKTLSLNPAATLRTALVAAKQDPESLSGAVTVNGEPAELSQRLKQDDYIAVTPKVAGGR